MRTMLITYSLSFWTINNKVFDCNNLDTFFSKKIFNNKVGFCDHIYTKNQHTFFGVYSKITFIYIWYIMSVNKNQYISVNRKGRLETKVMWDFVTKIPRKQDGGMMMTMCDIIIEWYNFSQNSKTQTKEYI